MKNLYPSVTFCNTLLLSVYNRLKPSLKQVSKREVYSNKLQPELVKVTAQGDTLSEDANFETTSLRLKLDKYNTVLNISLRTLEYVQFMENSTEKTSINQYFRELFSLKTTVEEQIIKSTEKISHYKFLLEASKA